MVTHWGMSERLGPVAFRDGEEHPFLGKEIAEQRQYSETTARIIDEEVGSLLRQAADLAVELLSKHRDDLDRLAGALENEETLDEGDLERLLGPPAYRRAHEASPDL